MRRRYYLSLILIVGLSLRGLFTAPPPAQAATFTGNDAATLMAAINTANGFGHRRFADLCPWRRSAELHHHRAD